MAFVEDWLKICSQLDSRVAYKFFFGAGVFERVVTAPLREGLSYEGLLDPYTLHPESWTLNPEFQTPNPEPWILYPELYTMQSQP